ncbi:MAG: sugar phosphate isomerase/epimerase [Phycisphaerae bacterium]|nr:sugar phosphate isomerase/epimerase [Phycisphaerae bacterium]
MRISASTDSLPDVGLPTALRLIAKAGYAAVSIGAGHVGDKGDITHFPTNAQGSTDFDGVDRAREAPADKLAKMSNVPVVSVEIHPLSVGTPTELAEELERVDQQLEWGRRLGLRSLCLGAGHRERQPWPLLIEALRQAAQQAAARNMTLCLANHCGSRFEQIEDLRYAIPEIGAVNVLIAVDTGEFHAAAVNSTHVFREFPNRIGLLKLADRRGRRATRLGHGEINLSAVLETAAGVGYNGWIAVQTLVAPGEDATEALIASREHTQRLLDALH